MRHRGRKSWSPFDGNDAKSFVGCTKHEPETSRSRCCANSMFRTAGFYEQVRYHPSDVPKQKCRWYAVAIAREQSITRCYTLDWTAQVNTLRYFDECWSVPVTKHWCCQFKSIKRITVDSRLSQASRATDRSMRSIEISRERRRHSHDAALKLSSPGDFTRITVETLYRVRIIGPRGRFNETFYRAA